MIEVTGIKLDPKWKWVAKDSDGSWYLYALMPHKRTDDWRPEDTSSTSIHRTLVLPDVPWQESLHKIIHTENGFRFEKPRPNFVVDDPVMVKDRSTSAWKRRHFAGWADNEGILAWDGGGTSFSEIIKIQWDEYRLPTPEELNRNANHK